MLQLFRRNMIFNSLLLLPYILIVHSGRFFINYGHPGPEHDWLFGRITGFLGLGENGLYYASILLIYAEAVLINRMVNENKLNQEGQLFAGLVFIILTGFHPMLFSLSPVLFGALFFILSLRSLISVYLMKNAAPTIFNVGFFAGLATICYVPYCWMIILGILGLILFRGFSLKEFLQMIAGFVCVVMLFWFYLYMTRQTGSYASEQLSGLYSKYFLAMSFGGKGQVALLLVLLLLLMALLQFGVFQVKAQISARKAFDFLFWVCLVSFFSVFFVRFSTVSPLIFLLVPLAVLLGVILAKVRNLLLAETLHLFFALLALFLQLQNW